MNLRDRIPVEPLSDERMTNIERNVVIAATDAALTAQPARRGSTWLGLALIAAAMVAVGITSWRLGASSTPEVNVVATEMPIHVDTMEGTKLDIGDARISSDPGTTFVVTRPAGGVLVDMARGKVELEVGTRGTRPPLIVRAGETDVVVVGTRFSVDYGDGTGEVVVIVTEGVVKVMKRDMDSPVRVAAGQAWTTKRGPIAIVELPTTQVASSGSTTTTTIDETDVEIEMPGSVHVGSNHTTSNGVGGGSGAKPGKKKVVFEDARKALLTAGIQPAYDVGIADARKAIDKHHEMLRDNARGDDASRALYSIAVLQKVGLKDNAAALKTLDQYMSRFAHKNRSEHADALWLRVRILCEKTLDDGCRRAARIYSEKAPSTFKSGIAERILVTPQ